nr:cytochrome c-type biogenesis protein [Rhodovulum sp. ES.010]
MKRLTLALFLALPAPAVALEPSELLDDPELEARARVISAEVRCLVCRNESIDDSNASLAKDLRRVVRERVVAGDTNDEVKAYLVDRYGEYVLLKPMMTGTNVVLYAAGPAMLLLGLGVGLVYIRSRRGRDAASSAALSAEEETRLKEIMGD